MQHVEPNTSPTRIVVVEDEAIIAADIERRIERLGYECVGVADNGADARALIAQQRPSLVLMDIIIQGSSDGIEVAAEVGRLSDVPIVFLTAHADASTIQRAKAVGPYGYLVKPFEERELHTTIEMALFRHRSEAKARLLRQSLMSASTAIGVVDARDERQRFIMCNPAFETMTGYTAEEIRQCSPCFLEGPDTDPEASARLRAAMAEHRDCELVLAVHRKDGSPFWSELMLTAVRDTVGEVTHFLFLHNDITERKRTEEALAHAQRMDALGQLTGGIAHDFNNILGVILSFTGFLADAIPASNEEARDDLRQVERAIQRGVGLTKQLLTLSRQQPTEPRPVDLNESIADIAKMLRRTVGDGVEIVVNASPRPAVVRMDPGLCDQVFLNLAVNARDAMPDGGRLVFTVSHPAEEQGGYAPGRCVRVVVSDEGHGMDRATMNRIFEPYFTTKPVGKGTGLGLATCFGIVKDAGGTLEVASEVGAGTTFTILLPVCDERVWEDSRGLPKGSSALDARVLVVDDDAALRKAAGRMLTARGLRVEEASNGMEALGALEAADGAFDLVVTDVVMPGLDGYQLLERIRGRWPHLRLLVTSGYAGGRFASPEHSSDVPLLWKPYSEASLMGAVADALSTPQASDAAMDSAATAPAATHLTANEHAATDSATPHSATTEPARTHPAGKDSATTHDTANEHAEKVGQPVAGGTRPPEAPQSMPLHRVLLVEDESVQRDACRRGLEAHGFAVSAAASVAAATELLEAMPFAAIVSDIDLPDGDGMGILRAARARDATVPVVLITGAPSVETATWAVQSRAVGYLAKPFPMGQLVRAVEQAVDSGEVLRLQHRLLAAHSGADAFLLDLPNTRRRFDAALDGLYMAFQPIVRSQSNSVFGYEALLRSQEPTFRSPLEILAAAEALGRMDEVGRAVRRSVTRDLGLHPQRSEAIFVNIHPSELSNELLCSVGEPLLRVADRIVLEVTERATLSTGPEVVREVGLLRRAGYRIAIDDLGEGYAGLSWLAHIKPDIAKIDMSLVRDIDRSPFKREITASLINVCRRSGITTLAEGVETEAEAEVLRRLGCELLQGYLFAKPGPAFPSIQAAS